MASLRIPLSSSENLSTAKVSTALSSSIRVDDGLREREAPNCYCDLKSVHKISQTQEHPGEPFFGCSRYISKDNRVCRFFQWVNIPQRALEDNEVELQKKADELQKKEEDFRKKEEDFQKQKEDFWMLQEDFRNKEEENFHKQKEEFQMLESDFRKKEDEFRKAVYEFLKNYYELMEKIDKHRKNEYDIHFSWLMFFLCLDLVIAIIIISSPSRASTYVPTHKFLQ